MLGDLGLACFLLQSEGNERGPSVRVVQAICLHGSAKPVCIVQGVVDDQTFLLASSRLPAAAAGRLGQEMRQTSKRA